MQIKTTIAGFRCFCFHPYEWTLVQQITGQLGELGSGMHPAGIGLLPNKLCCSSSCFAAEKNKASGKRRNCTWPFGCPAMVKTMVTELSCSFHFSKTALTIEAQGGQISMQIVGEATLIRE